MTIEIPISQTSSGTPSGWSFNTQKLTENVDLRQIIVKAATIGTTFDFYIEDANSNVIFDTRDEAQATTILRREVEIRLSQGIHTIYVTNSSADEAYTGKLVLSERVKG